MIDHVGRFTRMKKGPGGSGGSGGSGLIETVVTYASTIQIDASAADIFQCTLTGDVTIDQPLNPSVKRIYLRLIQDGTGNRVITAFNAVFRFSVSLPQPVLTTVADKADLLAFLYSDLAGKWDFIGEVYGF